MREVLNSLAHGRISVRRFYLVILAIIMVFLATLVNPTEVHAEDAARGTGDSITYAGQTYQPAPAAMIPAGLPNGTSGYYYVDQATNKAYFLLTTGDAKTATTAQAVSYNYTPPSQFTGASPPVTVTITPSATSSSCSNSNLNGIGWIICPTVRFIASSMDFIYGIVASFLDVKTVTADTNGPTYRLWSIIRDFANISFVIVFLIILYSQITSIGLSNYGIKKALPRLVIAAIALNSSYWIFAFAVDVSNLLGYSIHSLFMGLFDSLSSGANFTGDIPTWQSVTAVILAGGGAVAAGAAIASIGSVSGALALLIPILIAVSLAALVALAVLAARQALLMSLIIISPFAIVAYILPNTEKYFEKWRSVTLTLLFLFPIFSFIFSGAQLAGMAIVQTAGGNLVTIILGMAVQVAPIIITPLLVKFSSGLIGKLAGMINNPNKGIVDRTRNWAKDYSTGRRNQILAGRNRFPKISSSKYNVMTKAARRAEYRRRRRDGRRKAWEAGTENAFAASRWGSDLEELTRNTASDKAEIADRFNRSARGQRVVLREKSLDVDRAVTDNMIMNSAAGRAVEARSRAAAVHKTEIANKFDRTEVGQLLTHRQQMADAYKQETANKFDESKLGQHADHAGRTADREKQRIANDAQARWDNASRTDPGMVASGLKLQASEINAAKAKAKLEKMQSEIIAQGSKTEHLINLRIPNDANNHTKAGLLNIAHDIKMSHAEAALAGMAKSAAERQSTLDIQQMLVDDKVKIDSVKIRKYAAGVGTEASVLASAVAAGRKDFGQGVADQKELASHYKLSAGEFMKLAKNEGDGEVKDETGKVIYTFSKDDEHVRDMAIEEAFKIGSHGDKISIIEQSGIGGQNYEHRSTIQHAIISTGFAKDAPAMANKTLDEILRGEFSGEESWLYHSLRQVLEGRIKTGTLAGANASSLAMLFADPNTSPAAQVQYDLLIEDGVRSALEANPNANANEVRRDLINKFNNERKKMRNMAETVLSQPNIATDVNSASLDELRKFTESES